MNCNASVFGAVIFLLFSVTQVLASEQHRSSPVGSLYGNGAGFLRAARLEADGVERVHRASLFSGRDDTGLFATARGQSLHTSAIATIGMAPGGTATIERVLQLIGHAEAGPKGYDAVQYNAKILPPRRPTALSIAEIYRWIDETPGQQHAIGRYQFIPKTLKRLVRDLGVDERAIFSPRLQDRLAARLLDEAGLRDIQAGGIGRHQFMNNLARIWAGLPNSTGKSHYHGYAGNRATMSWARFDAEMARIFPG